MKKNALVTSVLWLAGFSATLLLSNARALAFEMTASGKVVPLGVVIDGRYYNTLDKEVPDEGCAYGLLKIAEIEQHFASKQFFEKLATPVVYDGQSYEWELGVGEAKSYWHLQPIDGERSKIILFLPNVPIAQPGFEGKGLKLSFEGTHFGLRLYWSSPSYEKWPPDKSPGKPNAKVTIYDAFNRETLTFGYAARKLQSASERPSFRWYENRSDTDGDYVFDRAGVLFRYPAVCKS